MMLSPVETMTSLVNALGLVMQSDGRALGELAGIPVAMTFLVSEQPESSSQAVLLQFRIDRQGTEFDPLHDLLRDVPADQARLSFDANSAWLTLYNIDQVTDEVILSLVECFGQTLAATDLAVAPGCLRCGKAPEAPLMCVDGMPTRLCPACLDEAYQEKEQAEAQLNRATLLGTLGLPAVFCYAALGWGGLWTAIGLLLVWMQVKVIPIDHFTMLLFMGLAVGVGWAFGRPLGIAVRKSVAFQRTPVISSLFLTLCVGACGEIVFVAFWMLRWMGIFDLRAAAGLVGNVVANYTPFWITCKVLLWIAVAIGAILSASQRKSVNLEV
ncbi:MAG: hypothetical protein ACKV0T_08480 [Planctomycetales bacterium]